MNQIVTIPITVKKINHDKMESALKSYMQYEHEHPEIFHYSSTRFYVKDSKENPDEEVWLCIDHFENYNDYMTSLKDAFENDPETQKHYQETLENMLNEGVDENNIPDRDLWTEVESLRVDDQGH
jgi:hypothetical protein